MTGQESQILLDDLLRPGLRLVICGTAAGERSAKLGAYYAGPGNKFWRVLHEVGLTPDRALIPSEFRELLSYGIGLTDLAKGVSGMDHTLMRHLFDPARFRLAVGQFAPRALAFNGKKAASVYLARPTKLIGYGRQAERIGETALYVLPSTSGAASGAWSIEPWRILAADVALA
jgi:TDG/mug DNA glycosylase family protein